jgi:hypothetical protein
MEASGNNFRELLNDLSFRTNKPIYADEKDRTWLLNQGVRAVPDPTEEKEAKQ